MKTGVLLFFLMLLVNCFGQNLGLNCELGFNADFNQRSQGVAVLNENSYFLHREFKSGSYFTYSFLNKIDTLGNLVWTQTIMPQFHENTDMKEIIVSDNSNMYLLGWGAQYCDLPGSDMFMSKYDENGNELWTYSWHEQNWFDIEMKGLKIIESGNLLVSYSNISLNPNESKIYSISQDGYIIDSLSISKPILDGADSLSFYQKIGFKQDSLYGFDASGNTISTKAFSSQIKNIEVFNDSLYLLTNDSIFLLNTNFQVIQSASISGYSNYSQLKITPLFVDFLSNNGTSISIHKLNHNLQILNLQTINCQIDSDDYINFVESHVSVTDNHNLTHFQSIRYLDFSRQSIENVTVNSSDIGILDFQSTQVEISSSSSPGVYTISVYGDALLKNYGNNLVDGCKINHLVWPYGICQPIVYNEYFSGINLQPGDSAWVNLGLIHQEMNFFPTDTITKEICLYSSHPNFLTDMNVPNDSYCETVFVGYVGLDEIHVNTKKMIRITDLTGRETEFKHNTVLIYYYSDGSIEKIFTFN